MITNQLLYQLSYVGRSKENLNIQGKKGRQAGNGRKKRATGRRAALPYSRSCSLMKSAVIFPAMCRISPSGLSTTSISLRPASFSGLMMLSV